MMERTSLEKLTGAVLGNYRLDKLIEQNKWGPIFLASTKTGTNYVIRFVCAPSQDSRATADARIVFLGRFQQEANQVATLQQHPHILPLLDYGNYSNIPYLVYPSVSLTSLRGLLTQNVTDLASVGRYLDQIASALEYAHQHAVIHRNLSTSCIYMQENRQLVVTEFGLMHMRELSKQDSQPTDNYTFDGSSESSTPEQLLGKPVDAYTDIYALGAVLYRLLTGHPPFPGKTHGEVARQHLYAEVPSLKVWREGLPVDLDHIITKAMAKEPLQRYRQPTAFAQAYHQIVAPNEPYSPLIVSQPLAAGQFQPLSSLSAPAKRLKKNGQQKIARRNMVTLLAAGGGVVVVGGIVLMGVKLINNGSTAGTATTGTGNTQPASSGNTKSPAGGSNVLARATDIPVNSAKTFPIANQKNPGVLIHLPDNKFVAFDSTCTHAACAVAYNQQNSLLECPCHGAIFNPAQGAAVVQGPATTPLAPVKITVNADGTITT
jgi:serine/threonine protein kinase